MNSQRANRQGNMGLILFFVVLILLFGGGDFYAGPPYHYYGGGLLFPVGNMPGYLNLKGYKEFDAANRPEGWNAWLTFSISQAAPPAAVRAPPQLVYK
jgi:hypothetical protein